MRLLACLACFLCLAASQAAFSAERPHPDCTGPDRWPAAMTGVRLKELGLSEKAGGYDKVEVELLASEPLPAERHGRPLFRQVHKVTIADGGRTFTVITVTTASFEECSESGGDVYVIAVACPAGGDCRRHRLPCREDRSALPARVRSERAPC